jgi:hypothetical protein
MYDMLATRSIAMLRTEIVTLHDHLAIGMDVIEFEKRGNLEEACAFLHTMPLTACLTKWAKKRFGAGNPWV